MNVASTYGSGIDINSVIVLMRVEKQFMSQATTNNGRQKEYGHIQPVKVTRIFPRRARYI